MPQKLNIHISRYIYPLQEEALSFYFNSSYCTPLDVVFGRIVLLVSFCEMKEFLTLLLEHFHRLS